MSVIGYDSISGKKIDNANLRMKITFTSNRTTKEILSHNGEATYSGEIKPNSNNDNGSFKATVQPSAPRYTSAFKATTSGSASGSATTSGSGSASATVNNNH